MLFLYVNFCEKVNFLIKLNLLVTFICLSSFRFLFVLVAITTFQTFFQPALISVCFLAFLFSCSQYPVSNFFPRPTAFIAITIFAQPNSVKRDAYVTMNSIFTEAICKRIYYLAFAERNQSIIHKIY